MDHPIIPRMDKTDAYEKKNMSAAIAVFAKTLGLSPVKTRLAASIGKERAEYFYQLCLEVVEEILSITIANITPPPTPYWAIAEQEALTHPAWQNMNQIWTGDGDLGQRLHNIYSSLRKNYGTVILTGTDCPQLNNKNIEQAISYLSKNSGFVIGKALDGGFYLFAGNVDIDCPMWTQTPYSVSSTCEILAKKLSAQNDIHYLNELSDVDIIEDLQTLLLHRADMTLPSQKKLLRWIDDLKLS
ncbi:MAG: DUF2064 domain-containing protein [Rickettsiales bacterium]